MKTPHPLRDTIRKGMVLHGGERAAVCGGVNDDQTIKKGTTADMAAAMASEARRRRDEEIVRGLEFPRGGVSPYEMRQREKRRNGR